MITKRGQIRQWHFAHKADACSYDKYLHSTAEIMIMDWFNKQKSIMLVMNTFEKCNMYDECKFSHSDSCKRKTTIQHDLKKYYSRCKREQGYSGFVADLLCENIKSNDIPIFIEIFVTHECSYEKKNSGIRIIEFKIESEKDILNIVRSSQIKEGINVRLYNFKRKDVSTDNISFPFQKYILFPTMKCYVNKSLTCKNYKQHHNGIYEISMPYDDCIPYFVCSGGLYQVGKAKAYIDGYLKKDCQLCYWQGKDSINLNICKLYKKCGTPKYCEDNDVNKCTMFRENRDVINLSIEEFNNYLKDNQIDIWKADLFNSK